MADDLSGSGDDALAGAGIVSQAVTTAANDRLLKALIALLALRDPGFLNELQTLFVLAARENSQLAEASDETWLEIGREIRAIKAFLAAESPDKTYES